MIDLVVCNAAEEEYAEALSWYAERSVQAAKRFDAEINHALKKIASDPQRFPLSSITIIGWLSLWRTLHENHGIGQRDSKAK